MSVIGDYSCYLSVLQAIFLGILLCTASICDIRKRIIPDWIHVLILLTACLHWHPTRIVGVFAAAPFFAGAVKGGMGGGDVKLVGAVGIVLGLGSGIMGSVMGLVCVLIYYAACKGIKGECSKNLPLAPFLAVGYLGMLFF